MALSGQWWTRWTRPCLFEQDVVAAVGRRHRPSSRGGAIAPFAVGYAQQADGERRVAVEGRRRRRPRRRCLPSKPEHRPTLPGRPARLAAHRRRDGPPSAAATASPLRLVQRQAEQQARPAPARDLSSGVSAFSQRDARRRRPRLRACWIWRCASERARSSLSSARAAGADGTRMNGSAATKLA